MKDKHEKKISILKPKIIGNLINIDDQLMEMTYDDSFDDFCASNLCLKDRVAGNISFTTGVFKNIDFQGVSMASLELTDVRFENCDLSNADFSGAIIHRTEFINCKLMGINLSDGTLQNVYIKECNSPLTFMRFVKMKQVLLEECIFKNCNLQSATLSKVEFKKCDFTSSQMSGTSLKGMDISDCEIEGVGIDAKDVEGATISPYQAIYFAKLLGLIVKF